MLVKASILTTPSIGSHIPRRLARTHKLYFNVTCKLTPFRGGFSSLYAQSMSRKLSKSSIFLPLKTSFHHYKFNLQAVYVHWANSASGGFASDASHSRVFERSDAATAKTNEKKQAEKPVNFTGQNAVDLRSLLLDLAALYCSQQPETLVRLKDQQLSLQLKELLNANEEVFVMRALLREEFNLICEHQNKKKTVQKASSFNQQLSGNNGSITADDSTSSQLRFRQKSEDKDDKTDGFSAFLDEDATYRHLFDVFIEKEEKIHQYLLKISRESSYFSFFEKPSSTLSRFSHHEDAMIKTKSAARKNAGKSKTSEETLVSQENKVSSHEILKFHGNQVILEVRPGVGGNEAALFAMELFKMYEMHAHSKGWEFSTIELTHSDDARGLKEGIAEIAAEDESENVYDWIRFESGIHRVQRVPATERHGRMHTSAASVVVMPKPGEVSEEDIHPSELKVETMRSSGPGGQSVNKSETAVRVTHLPSKLSVVVRETSSQLQNKSLAIKVLQARLLDRRLQQAQKETRDVRSNHIAISDRSAKIRTYNFAHGTVTDHRCKAGEHPTVYVHPLMEDGRGLDNLLEALKFSEDQQKLLSILNFILRELRAAIDSKRSD